MSSLPKWYQTQLPSLDDCGPACVTAALNFIGWSGNIKHAKAFYDGSWTHGHIVAYFDQLGVKYEVHSDVRSPAKDEITIMMSRYMLFRHWILTTDGKYYCPIDGAVARREEIEGYNVITININQS